MPENNRKTINTDDLTRDDMEQFIQEKEQIRQIVGQIGGKPTMISRFFTVAMIVFIVATLIAAPFLPQRFELPAVEIGLVLLSLKIFFFLQNEAKVTHFQFWMLTSLEWRMNNMARRLDKMESHMEKLADFVDQNP